MRYMWKNIILLFLAVFYISVNAVPVIIIAENHTEPSGMKLTHDILEEAQKRNKTIFFLIERDSERLRNAQEEVHFLNNDPEFSVWPSYAARKNYMKYLEKQQPSLYQKIYNWPEAEIEGRFVNRYYFLKIFNQFSNLVIPIDASFEEVAGSPIFREKLELALRGGLQLHKDQMTNILHNQSFIDTYLKAAKREESAKHAIMSHKEVSGIRDISIVNKTVNFVRSVRADEDAMNPIFIVLVGAEHSQAIIDDEYIQFLLDKHALFKTKNVESYAAGFCDIPDAGLSPQVIEYLFA